MSPHNLFAAGLAAAVAISPQTAEPPRTVAAVHTVRIDAIAVDRQGAAVSTLTPRDFELREDGQLLAVDEAQFVRRGARLVAVFVDEYHITPGESADRARAALGELVDRALGPDDLLAVMKPLDSLFAIRLTNDREQARRIIAGVEGRKGDLSPRTDYERTYMTGTPDRVEAARAQVAVSAINALAVQMGSLNDLRKTLLVVSERLDAPPRRRGQEHLATIDGIVRSANRANVSIYPVDTRRSSEAGGSANEVLGSLARDTGGRLVAGARSDDDLDAAIRGALRDADAYYMLTYQQSHVEDGAFHPVDVRVTRAGVQVRARAGYWAPSADDRELLALANTPPVVRPLEPPGRSSPLIRPWFGLSMGDAGRMRVTFVWEPSAVVPGDPVGATAARLELTVLGEGDAVVFEGPVRPAGPGVVAAGREPSRATFDTAPGRLRLRMTIRDADDRRVDSDARVLLVRDLRGKVAIGTPEFLRARNAREFRALDADRDAVPVSSREFSRTERLLIRFPAYSPDGRQPSVSARLLNRMGQPMRTLDVRTAAAGEHEIDLLLSGLASGDYQVEVAATSAAGQVAERLEFRVTN